MFEIYLYNQKRLKPVLLKNGYLLSAILKSNLNDPKELNCSFALNRLDPTLVDYLISPGVEILVENDKYKWKMAKLTNQYSHYLPVIATEDTTKTVVLDNSVIADEPDLAIDSNVTAKVFGKTALTIKNLAYTGSSIRVKFINIDDSSNTDASPQRLFKLAAGRIDSSLSIDGQTLNDNVLNTRFYGGLHSIDYLLPGLGYGEIYTGSISEFLKQFLPQIDWQVSSNVALNNYQIPLKSNLEIIDELRTNLTLIDYGFDTQTNRSIVKIAKIENESTELIAVQMSTANWFDKKPVVLNVKENYPSLSFDLLTKNYIQEGTKIKILATDNGNYYNASYIFGGFNSFDLLNSYNTENANVKVFERSSQKPKKTIDNLLFKI